MKRAFNIICIIAFLSLPCVAKNTELSYDKDLIILPNIFITDISEAEEEIDTDNITLKGYAEYLEDSEAIYLKDDNDQFVLNLKVPQKITSQKLADEHKKINKKTANYSKYGGAEYKIAPETRDAIISAGDLSFGTTIDEEVDYAELEHTATFFTKYKKNKFALTSAYERTIGSTYNNYIDTIYIAPEIKINKILSIKEVLSDNRTYRRKKAELVLSINPLANRKEDRLNFEIGASRTYYEQNDFIRDRIRFNTRFKL